MASYSFAAGDASASREERLNASFPAVPSMPLFTDEAEVGRARYPVPGGPRGYRTLAEAANALAEAAAVASGGNPSLAGSTATESTQRGRGDDASQQRRGPPPGVPDIRVAMLPQAVPVLVSDDVVSGTKRDGWMSPVRRFFCLLVTFDVLFTSLLWLITVIVTGELNGQLASFFDQL